MDENAEIDQASSEEVNTEITDSNEQPEIVETSENVEGETESLDDEVEVDYDGEKYRVPTKLKDALLRMADYTQKTQEVAKTRQEIEAERAVFEQERQLATQSFQRQQANLEAYANLTALDKQLEVYQNANWSQLSDQDPVEAQKLFMQYNQLRDQRAGLANYISQSETKASHEQQARIAQMIEKGKETLTKEIPNWNDSLAKEVSKSALTLGMTEAELNQIIEPRHVKVLYYAKIGYEAMQKAKAQPKATVEPLKTVKSTNSGKSVDPEKMSMEEWASWRNKQVNKK